MQLGLYSFGELISNPDTGRGIPARQRLEEVIAAARLADETGLEMFGVGEHHRADFTSSSTATVLAAIAAVTKRIRLTSASTLLGTADPVRTFQEFATVDLISNGRAEIIAGRGATTENFPLFGYDLGDYDALFVEKLGLLMKLNESERITWSGNFRAPLHDVPVAPRPVQPRLPLWIGAGSPNSVVRAASLRLPLALPMLGSSLPHYARIVALYREAWSRCGFPPEEAKVATFSHMFIGETSQSAREGFYPYYAHFFRQMIGQDLPRAAFEQMASPAGMLLLGSPQEVVDKLMLQHEAFGNCRYLGQIDHGGQPFAKVAKAIELFATKVAPVLK